MALVILQVCCQCVWARIVTHCSRVKAVRVAWDFPFSKFLDIVLFAHCLMTLIVGSRRRKWVKWNCR